MCGGLSAGGGRDLDSGIKSEWVHWWVGVYWWEGGKELRGCQLWDNLLEIDSDNDIDLKVNVT